MLKRYFILSLFFSAVLGLYAEPTPKPTEAILKPASLEEAKTQYKLYLLMKNKEAYSDVTWTVHVYGTVYPGEGFSKDAEWLLVGLYPKPAYYLLVDINLLYSSLNETPKPPQALVIRGHLKRPGRYILYMGTRRVDVNAIMLDSTKAVVVPGPTPSLP